MIMSNIFSIKQGENALMIIKSSNNKNSSVSVELLDKVNLYTIILADQNIPCSSKAIAGWLLLYHYNTKTGQCNPSLRAIGKALGMSRGNVSRFLQPLIKADYLIVKRHFNNSVDYDFDWAMGTKDQVTALRKRLKEVEADMPIAIGKNAYRLWAEMPTGYRQKCPPKPGIEPRNRNQEEKKESFFSQNEEEGSASVPDSLAPHSDISSSDETFSLSESSQEGSASHSAISSSGFPSSGSGEETVPAASSSGSPNGYAPESEQDDCAPSRRPDSSAPESCAPETYAPDSAPESCAEPNPKNDAAFDEFWIAYPRKPSKKNEKIVLEEARMAYDILMDQGVDLNSCLQAFRQKIDSDPTFDKKFIKYPNTWLQAGDWRDYTGEKMMTEKDALSLLEDIFAFVRDNTGEGQWLLTPDHSQYCSKQIQRYKNALGGQEPPDKHIPMIESIMRMKRGELLYSPPIEDNDEEMTEEEITEIQAAIAEKQLAAGIVH
jgi:hypothetical protein